MRKMVMLAAMMALAALMLAAAPALAVEDNDRRDNNNENSDFGDFVDEFCEDFDGDFLCDKDEDNNLDGFGDLEELFQTSEQEAESGEVDQSFDVSNTGDNSNQCVGAQGVANTGNAQNQTNLIQYGSEADDFEFDEVGSSVDVSPVNTTECNQQV